MNRQNLALLLPLLFLGACVEEPAQDEQADPESECVFCADGKADAFGIERDSYLAYGILEVANTATFDALDNDVPLDIRAARGIVADRPFEFIEQVDTVSYVGRRAFANLADYAELHGYVPFCGDGGVQPILEGCDDGNELDGDGCSSLCQVEAGGGNSGAFLATQSDLIKGSEIGVSLVDPNAYYLRSRPLSGPELSADIEDILDRADGINANSSADDIVSFDELAILSKEPFYSSLFQGEKDALRAAWSIFEVSSAPVAEVVYSGGPIHRVPEFQVNIERPGPVAVDSVRAISSLTASQQEVCRRLQQMPAMNADGNSNTVELGDIDKALADYQPVFTASEVRALEAIRVLFFSEALPESGGDFNLEFAELPNQGVKLFTVAEFDDYKFVVQTRLEVHHDAYDPTNSYSNFDANLRTDFSLTTSLLYKGQPNNTCSWPYTCLQAFRYNGVRFMTFAGKHVAAGSQEGPVLMERWKDGERIYNRVVDFDQTYRHNSLTKYHNEYALARPSLSGQALSLIKSTTKSYGSKRYQRFKLSKVQTEFNKNVKKFFPNNTSMLHRRLVPGRRIEFEGVVIDIHESRAVVAYIGSCELPMKIQNGDYVSASCNGRHATISFSNTRAALNVYQGSSRTTIALYDSNRPYEALDLDRDYYIIQ